MSERVRPSERVNPIWRDRIFEGIDSAFNLYTEFGPYPISMSPRDLTEHDDTIETRQFIGLDPDEQKTLRDAFFFTAGYDEAVSGVVATYDYILSEKVSDTAMVRPLHAEVMTTLRSEKQDIFMHRTRNSAGIYDYFVAPFDFRL